MTVGADGGAAAAAAAGGGGAAGAPAHSAMRIFSPTPPRLDSAELIDNRECF